MKLRAPVLSVLAAALLPGLAAATDTPPLLPYTASFSALEIKASTIREFDIELPRTQKFFAFDLKASTANEKLSGALLITNASTGQPLFGRELNGIEQVGGMVPLGDGVATRRLRISIHEVEQDMRVDMILLPPNTQLRKGQAVPVFARQRGSDAFAEHMGLRVSRKSDVDIVTWGGDATATLRVSGSKDGGSPTALCEDSGDAWRRCTLSGLDAGDYQVSISGNGSPINLSATWRELPKP